MKGEFAKCSKCNAQKIISLTASNALAFLGITLMAQQSFEIYVNIVIYWNYWN